ncbi:MAG: TatD family hydrolase [Kiritimatiellae bacterium]|jgi:TatD DNase family protein|nr:TatD family hydrolase [Kiritimatiellia bacterium]
MNSTWTDAHCHLQDPDCLPDIQNILAQASSTGIERFVVNGTCPDDWARVASLADAHAEIVPQFGVHPWKVEGLQEDWELLLLGYLHRYPRAGIGEIGLDSKLTSAPMDLQREVFRRQLNLVRELDRPCTIHLIGAWAELHEELKEGAPSRFLLHSFGGSPEQVDVFARRNAWFSFGGAVLRIPASNKLEEAIRAVPEDRLLLETDSPFQHPQGKDHRQEPANLLHIAEEVARIRRVELNDLSRQSEANLNRFLQTAD